MEQSNPHMDRFIRRLKHRYSKDSENMLTSEWLELNTTLRKRAFSMKRHPFQRAIVDDMHVNLSCIKPSQVGMTEVQIRKALAWLRRNEGVSCIYTMPTDEMRNRLSQTRVKPIIEEDKVFNSEFDEEAVRSKGLLQFGQSFLYLTGAKEGDATSIPADFVMNDEIDLTDEEIVTLFRSRLQGSQYRINQKFSTPTYPKKGISSEYEISDQMEYMVQCDACNHWQTPVFSRPFAYLPGVSDNEEDLFKAIHIDNVHDIDLNNAYVKCEKCSAALDLANEDKREWVATYPSRSQIARGYRIRPFSTSNLDLPYLVKELLESKRKNTPRRFYNTVLGESYIDDSIALSEDLVNSRFQTQYGWLYSGQMCYIGIDVGLVCHITIGSFDSVNGWIIHYWDIVDSLKLVEEVERLMTQYNIVSGTIDRFPYTPTAVAVRQVSRGKIIPVEYRNPLEINVKENELNSDETFAQLNRTAALDEVAKLIRARMMTFVNYADNQKLIVRHITDMVRHEEEGEKPKWVKQTGEDHFFHAIAFMVAAKKAQEFLVFNSAGEIRTMVAQSVIDTKKVKTDNLIPEGSKRRDKIGFKE